MKPLTGALEKPWWDENVSPDLTPPEILELLDRDFPNHPAHDRIKRAAEGYEKARAAARAEQTFLCPACQDQGWVEVDSAARGTIRRCNGAMASGCRYLAQRPSSRPEGESGERRYS